MGICRRQKYVVVKEADKAPTAFQQEKRGFGGEFRFLQKQH